MISRAIGCTWGLRTMAQGKLFHPSMLYVLQFSVLQLFTSISLLQDIILRFDSNYGHAIVLYMFSPLYMNIHQNSHIYHAYMMFKYAP